MAVIVELFKVKQNNDYDFVQDTKPSSDGTWLCSLTSSPYTRGHSYNVSGETATRIEQPQDVFSESILYEVTKNTLDYLNNYFYVVRQSGQSYYQNFESGYNSSIKANMDYNRYLSDASRYTFSSGVVTGVNDDPFVVNDLIQIRDGLRNNLVSYVTAQTTGQVTLDNAAIRDTTENAFMFLVSIPPNVVSAICKMIWWDAFKREFTDKKNETVGNYSYTQQDPTIGGVQYPNDMVAAIMQYKAVKYAN